jgi:sugar O-acyltransferase (sialic acid O-acetyltransferase NeuD family)
MAKESIILIGAGGHCKSIIDIIEGGLNYTIAGILAKEWAEENFFLDYPIIGNDDCIETLAAKGVNFHIAVGQLNSNLGRINLFKRIKKAGGKMPVIISPNAHVSKRAIVNEGSIIMHNAVVNTDARIGSNCIINTGAVIEHDTIIGNNCHISTGVYINGNCTIGDNSFIGSNATIIQGITIGADNIIGAGSVVVRDTHPGKLYAGNPAKEKK